ncbi:MAG: M15 family metallopeptidase [Dehalobacterium sp.]
MKQMFIDTRQSLVPRNNRKRIKKKTRSMLILSIVFILGFLIGTFSEAQAKDQVIQDKLAQLQNAGQSDSTGKSDATSNTPKDTGAVSNSAQTKPSSKGEWQLVLVNPWNKLPDDYKVTLRQLKNGQVVDERCYPDLQQMIDDCRAAGLSPVICSSYRSRETQERLFNNKVTYYTNLGYSLKSAETESANSIAVPGTSEHHLGLAVDIVDINNQNLDSSQEKTAVQQWLLKNSWKYGFILRFPSDKSDITGIIYEPWHYRYVGKEAAEKIHDQGICLEEYLSQR